jgi:hypothetical protein
MKQENFGVRAVMHLSPPPGGAGGWQEMVGLDSACRLFFPQHPIQASNFLLPPIILIFGSGDIATTKLPELPHTHIVVDNASSFWCRSISFDSCDSLK